MLDAINQDLKQALLARDKTVVDTLRMLKSAIQNAEIAKRAKLDETELAKILVKQAKQRHEAADLYAKAGADDRAAAERAELKIIEKYLPEQLSSDELAKLVDDVIAELKTGDELPHQGAIIQAVIAKAHGRANGSEIAAIVRQKVAQ